MTETPTGDIWLCAGQSNMVLPLGECDGGARAVAHAGELGLSLAVMPEHISATRVDDSPPSFEPSSPPAALDFSGVGYWFGRRLQEELDSPISLIGSYWNGKAIDGWMPESAFHTNEVLEAVWQRWEKYAAEYTEGAPRCEGAQRPGRIFNAMIAPLTDVPIKGVIWYQGEANCVQRWHYPRITPREYADAFPAMIEAWRTAWGYEFPFIWVQLHGFRKRDSQPAESAWAEVREAQLKALNLPKTAMVSAVDLGDPAGKQNHPPNKAPVAERLANAALALVYGRDVQCSGPLPAGVDWQADGSAIISWKHAEGLHTSGGAPCGFAVADGTGHFVWAEARIEGETVVVGPVEGIQATALRYGWADNPRVNLYNAAELPASPFRTDNRRRQVTPP